MPAPLSADLRRRIVDAGRSATAAQLADRFGVSISSVERYRRLDRENGSLAPKPHGGGHAHLITDDDRQRFEGYLAENPSMTHAVMARRFKSDTERVVSPSTVRRALGRWRLSRKKSP